MASGNTGRTLTTYFRSMGRGFDHPVDNPRTRFSRRIYTQPLNAKQKAESKAKVKSKDFTTLRAAVIGQWICFVLGTVCIVCGSCGVFAKHIEDPLSASVAWLGSAYMPTLRVTALLCFLMGVLLVRHGWSSPIVSKKRSEHERRP
jgi:ABC-type amino acid transport system permease subunit